MFRTKLSHAQTLLLQLLLILAAQACGGAEEASPGRSLSGEDRAYFDDTVDYIAEPESLTGEYRREWSSSLDQRVRRADVIAYVRVQTLNEDQDPSGARSYRISLAPSRVLSGELDELYLRVRQGDPGYVTVQRGGDELLGRAMILFLAWDVPVEGAEPIPAWHLSPATDQVTRRTEYLIENRRNERVREGRVIVHEY